MHARLNVSRQAVSKGQGCAGRPPAHAPSFKRRHWSVQATADVSQQEPSSEQEVKKQEVEKVPISDLPRPHPKASQTLNKSMNKSGMYQALVDTLNGVSFTIVCDDQELAWRLSEGLSKRIGWFPVSTGRVLAGIHKLNTEPKAAKTIIPRDQLLQAIGSEEKLAIAELGVLSGLRSQRRVIACTLPGGALAQPDSWRDVWGTFIVWVDEVDSSAPKPKTPERELLAERAEVMVRLKKSRGFATAGKTPADKAKLALEALTKDLVAYLNANKDIIERKVKYVSYGCRGDWPDVQPAEWSPVLEGFDRKPVAGEDAAAAQQPAAA